MAGGPLLALLAGCGPAGSGSIAGEPIACLLPGKSGFEQLCTVDRMRSPDGIVLTARMPDGGFRRLLVVKDGRGVIAADGAEPVTVKPGKDSIDVTAGSTVYRLPARIAP